MRTPENEYVLPSASPVRGGSHADFVLAIDFGGTKVAVATVDLSGQLLEQQRIETNAINGALQAVARIYIYQSARRNENFYGKTS